jgi:hypothetical protein
MMRLLRKRMLEGLQDTPKAPIATELTVSQRLTSIICCASAIASNVLAYKGIRHLLVKNKVPFASAVWLGLAGVTGITAGLYVYNVYLIDMLSSSSKRDVNGKEKSK